VHFSLENYRKLQFVSSASQNTTITSDVNVVLQIWGLLGHEKSLVLSNELINVELPPWKIWKADVSSVSPSSERIRSWLNKSGVRQLYVDATFSALNFVCPIHKTSLKFLLSPGIWCIQYNLFIVINLVSSIPFLDNGQVFYVDYGNSARLPLSSLRVLRWGENRELQFLH